MEEVRPNGLSDDTRRKEEEGREEDKSVVDTKKEESAVVRGLLFSCIITPSWDVYTDLSFTLQMIKDGNPLYALSSVVPQIFNIFFTYFAWSKWEHQSARRLSWVLVFTQCWPQFFAARIIWKIKIGIGVWSSYYMDGNDLLHN